MAMIAITTNNSISENPARRIGRMLGVSFRLGRSLAFGRYCITALPPTLAAFLPDGLLGQYRYAIPDKMSAPPIHVAVPGNSSFGDTRYAHSGFRIGSKSANIPASDGRIDRSPRAISQ